MSLHEDRIKVLLISGFWRSGSTILTRVLGELPETFAAGGLETIWEYSYINNGRCGCGSAFRECGVWQQVTEDAFGGFEGVNAQWMEDHQPRMRHLPLMHAPGGQRLIAKQFADYIETLDRLYTSLAKVTGSRIIVDSSKPPPYAYVLGLVPSVDLYVVHLVRDPRGVQHSILRRKHQGDPRFQQHSVAKSLLMWDAINVSQELFGFASWKHYLRLRYEDFIREPIGAIEEIKAFLGEPDLGLPCIEDDRILLHTNHTANGSENRSETGAVSLRLDDQWRTGMAKRDRSLVTSLTFPMLRYYGYTP